MFSFFFNDTATTEIYTLSLHDALPISTHLLFSHAGEHGALDPQPGRVEGNVGRAAADVLAEGLNVLQARSFLLSVEVHAGAPDAHQVQRVVPAFVHAPAPSTPRSPVAEIGRA